MSKNYIKEIKENRSSYIFAAHLVTAMDNYIDKMDQESIDAIENFASKCPSFPLPSGRQGSPIALALELNNYVAAEYLIKTKEGITGETIICVSNDNDEYSLKDVYVESQSNNYDSIPEKTPILTEEEYTKLLDIITRNNIANKRLEISLTKKNQK